MALILIKMKKALLTITILLSLSCCSLALAASPALFFSDLIDGPRTGWNDSATKGAAVTIWGKNFGSARGSSYVTVGGVNLTSDSDYAEWGVTANNASGLERISFWLNSSCAQGAGAISVTVGGITSNSLSFHVRNSGNIYFVDSVNGNNSYNGRYSDFIGGTSGPKQTIGSAKSLLVGGDILYIRAGTYNTQDSYDSVLCLQTTFNGSINNYTAFVGYPAEFPIFDGRTVASGGVVRNVYTNTGYTVLSKIKLLPRIMGVRIQQSNVSHYRIIGLEIDGQGGGGGWVGAIDLMDISDFKIYGCHAHNWGIDKYDHGIYVGTNAVANDERYDIGWNEFHDLGTDVSGIYIHPQDTDSSNTYADEIDIHDNLCYNLSHAGIHLSSRHKNVRIYNNIIYNCGLASGRSAVMAYSQASIVSNVSFYCNTIYSSASDSLVSISGDERITLKNNIFYSLSNTRYLSVVSGHTGIKTSDYDLFYGNGAPPAWATHALNSNPQFFNAAAYDFHLQSSSPAKDTGTSDVSTIVTQDYDGIARPQSTGYDIGAYEYASGQTGNPPVLNAIGNKSVNENVSLTFTISATDADGDTLTYSASGLPSGATLNSSTGVFNWTPTYAQAGSYNVTFSVSDGNGGTDSEAITITVNNVNRIPVLAAIGNKTVFENSALTFTLSATDADSDDTLTYSASGLPSGATLNGSTGAFSWTPTYSQAGSYNVTFSVSDGKGGTASEAVTITVNNVNSAPVLAAIGNKTAAESSALAFTLSATDADGDALTYSAANLPSGATLNSSTGAFSWTPVNSQIGSHTVTFTVTDTAGASDSETIIITVNSKDVEPPYAEGKNPDSDEVQVPSDTNITFHIKDKITGVNLNTLSMSIQREGDSAPTNIILNGISQLSQYPNSVIIQGNAADYVITYDPPNAKEYKFSYEEVVTVNISADDLAGNSLSNYRYSFTTAMMLRGKNLKVSKK